MKVLEQIESSQRQHNENRLDNMRQEIEAEKADYNLFSLLKPKIFIDGDRWCVLYGEDIQSGICGFGKSPYLAIKDWSSNCYTTLKVVK